MGTEGDINRDHTPQAIRKRLDEGPAHSYISDFIYGAIDGAVTTFAVVCGVVGANLSSNIVVILGIANLLADGFSMGASNFLGTRAELMQQKAIRDEEEREIDDDPEGERNEIREIFRRKGFEGDDLDRAVEIITSDRERWIETMLTEEHGIGSTSVSPLKAATITFVAFCIIGAVPLLPFVIQTTRGLPSEGSFLPSIVMTGIAFFAVGALKSRFTSQRWIIGGAETLAIGGAAAIVAYYVGALLRQLVDAA